MQASHCGGFSCCGAWALGAWASVVVAHKLSCSAAFGVFPACLIPDQGSNSFLLTWQVDSYPLCHQGSPKALALLNSPKLRYNQLKGKNSKLIRTEFLPSSQNGSSKCKSNYYTYDTKFLVLANVVTRGSL